MDSFATDAHDDAYDKTSKPSGACNLQLVLKQIVQDPVVSPDCHSYERVAIEGSTRQDDQLRRVNGSSSSDSPRFKKRYHVNEIVRI